jgi:hypothetical protein
MARIIVTTDPNDRCDATVLLDECVYSVHLASDHAAAQLVQRLRWAVTDAEDPDHVSVDRLPVGVYDPWRGPT